MTILLPSNATPLESSLEKTNEKAVKIKVPIRDLYNPELCPEPLLPWLAWHMSVDYWSDNWTSSQKRNVIRKSMAIHRIKGTRKAIDMAIESLGYNIAIVEWWEEEPKGSPYTFKVSVNVDDKGFSKGLYEELMSIVVATKNLRSHLKGMDMKVSQGGSYNVGSFTTSGAVVSIYPESPEQIETVVTSRINSALVIYQTIIVGDE